MNNLDIGLVIDRVRGMPYGLVFIAKLTTWLISIARIDVMESAEKDSKGRPCLRFLQTINGYPYGGWARCDGQAVCALINYMSDRGWQEIHVERVYEDTTTGFDGSFVIEIALTIRED